MSAIQRFEAELDGLQGQYDLLNEKIARLRQALAIETDVAGRFKQEKQLAQAETERAELLAKIEALEAKIEARPSGRAEARGGEAGSSATIDHVAGDIHDTNIAGRDLIEIGEVKLNIVPIESILGQRLPERNLPALRATLQQALPHLAGAEQAATRAAIDKLGQLIAALPQHERDYLERVRQRFARPETIFVELEADSYEQPDPAAIDPEALDLAAVAELMRQRETMPDLEELQRHGQEIKRVRLPSLGEATARYACIILLGDPGSGKTTALNHLAYELADQKLPPPATGRAREGVIPLPLRLSEFGSADRTVEAFIDRSWRGSLDSSHWAAPELADNLAGYLAEGRLLILFDALNEMPATGFKQRAAALRDFIEQWQKTGNRFVVTCRVLDYGEELQGLQRVEVQPFNDDQIRTFLQKVLHHQWSKMWTALTGGSDETHRLLAMARNPYMLTMMVSEFVRRRGRLSANRAELITGFTETLLAWAKHKPHLAPIWLDEAVQAEALSVTAFEMQQRRGSGAAMATRHVKKFIPAEVQTDPDCPADPIPNPDDLLTLAAGANLIEMPVDRSRVRFYHQLLQEYFSAREMLKRIGDPDRSGFQNLTGLDDLWHWPWLEADMPLWQRPEDNYDPLPPPKPTGWEETTILAAGLAPENDDQLLRALIQINPVLAGRCLHEGPAKVDQATQQAVIAALLLAIKDPKVALRVRIAAGEVLGYLGDPRPGELVTLPAGKFVMGGKGEYDGKPQHKLRLPEYRISKYLLTNAEYAAFIEAGGYREKRWWTKAGWQQKEKDNWTEPDFWWDSRFNKPNQPVVGISWYEAVAYCRWRSAETGQTVRLPTEAEWEKAARGMDGRVYPWGDDFDPTRLNMRLGEQHVNATTPVGIYPSGASPYGLLDGAGNVWEWCATKWGKKYPYRIEHEWNKEYLEGTDVRVLRGGSWFNYDESNARCAYRFRGSAGDRYFNRGVRLVVSPI